MVLKIGTRESPLAVWQATEVQKLLLQNGVSSELIYIKSEGDLDLKTPLYEIGVQGIFTRSLDIALLQNKIDIAVHSMKDVPTQLPQGIAQAAVLPRASYHDILVYKKDCKFLEDKQLLATIATSSIRRKAQWLHQYPNHQIENLRGNVNTRLQKVANSDWHGAIFAAAGLERIGLKPINSHVLEWMLPAPAQGAIVILCKSNNKLGLDACKKLNDTPTSICTKIERDFLRTLLGGCSTPISALAEIKNEMIYFKGSVLSLDGKLKQEIATEISVEEKNNLGKKMALELLNNGAQKIVDAFKK